MEFLLNFFGIYSKKILYLYPQLNIISKNEKKMEVVTSIELTKKAIQALNTNVLTRVAGEVGVSFNTMYRWKHKAPDQLSTIRCLSAIQKYTGLTPNEIFIMKTDK